MTRLAFLYLKSSHSTSRCGNHLDITCQVFRIPSQCLSHLQPPSRNHLLNIIVSPWDSTWHNTHISLIYTPWGEHPSDIVVLGIHLLLWGGNSSPPSGGKICPTHPLSCGLSLVPICLKSYPGASPRSVYLYNNPWHSGLGASHNQLTIIASLSTWIKEAKPLWSNTPLQKYLWRLASTRPLTRHRVTYPSLRSVLEPWPQCDVVGLVDWCAQTTGYACKLKSRTHNRSLNSFLELDQSMKSMIPRARSKSEFIFLEQKKYS